MINSRLEHNSREGDGHYKTDGAFYVQSKHKNYVEGKKKMVAMVTKIAIYLHFTRKK
jgi:hypothetical protein